MESHSNAYNGTPDLPLREPCPREKANIFSLFTFWWTLPIFFKSKKRTLNLDDLYQPLKEHKSDELGDKLCQAWEEELMKSASENREPSLLKTFLRVFGWQIMLLGFILLFLELFLKITQPLFLGGLISYYSKSGGDVNEAYLYAGGIVFTSAVSVILTHPFLLGNFHWGMKLRVAACSMIYRKALRLSKTSLSNTTAGQVVNLLSNDVGRFELSVIFIHYLWVGPVETFLATYLMYREIGISSIFGVIFLLLFIPLQVILGKQTSILRLRTALRTDERVRFMNEIIQGIQVIKMYAWEKPFAGLVALTRKREIKVIRFVSYIRGVLLSFIMFITRVSIFISLVAFALLGNIVTAEKAFVITCYYNILRQTMTVYFPQGIAQLAETLVSIKRIQNFMLYDELDKLQSSQAQQSPTMHTGINAHLSESGVVVQSVRAKWDPSSTDYTLNEIDLRVQPGTLVAVIGPVGSGKSSLFQAILGELPIESGTIKVNGIVSYASQEPWLFSGSIRQNILFGQPMNKKKYKKVIRKCALERDFSLFPNGDKTIVGEKGQSLSGGQKARISLARAVYRQANVYLLDDPLSAVDSHVGKHLFEQCMRDYLRGHIVILITHQLQYLQNADQIVIIEEGRVCAVGTYDSLQQSGLDFAKLLTLSSDDEYNSDKQSSSFRSRSQSINQSKDSSAFSITSVDDLNNLMEVEETWEKGSVDFRMYVEYFKAGGGLFIFIIVISFFVFAQLLGSYGDYFLTYWVQEEKQIPVTVNYTNVYDSRNIYSVEGEHDIRKRDIADWFTNMWELIKNFFIDLHNDPNWDLYLFTTITVLTVLFTLARSFIFVNVGMKASRRLHNAMFNGVTRASMYFFNTNPSGRILNRFSKDMGQVDEILPGIMIDVIQISLTLLGIVVVVALVNYWYLVPTLLMGILFYYMRDFYLLTSRNIKRMEATTRSPVYSHLSASLNGLSTIRAFGAERVLIKEFDNHQDLHSSAFYLFLGTSRAFGFWLDFVCVIYIAVVTLSFFLFADNGGNVGLAITQALSMTGMVQWGMRQSAELENTMTSVERIIEYNTVDPEGELEAPADTKPPKSWPHNGRIYFNNVSLRYFPDMSADRVLKKLELEIHPKEKVGIVGRTGAGKSSMINALFRLSYNEGSIVIDDFDTNDMGLHDLRSKISIIPQEPVLFSGTMRFNLDPFDEYTDDKLWNSLSEVKLKEVVSEMPAGLLSRISEGGSNFSVGQRQLVCLARAILRENRILVMDEATANVDPQTDFLIQETIRKKFSNCTVLTIAHRLQTIMDSDKVIVMDAGKCVEFGTPYELLTAEAGPKVFYDMVQKTGKSTFDQLFKIAEQAYIKGNIMTNSDEEELSLLNFSIQRIIQD